MGQVTVTIDGKAFRLACEEGQEAHLRMLAAYFDARIADLRGSFGEIGDLRLAIMAGLMVCDELMEARGASTRLADDMAQLQDDRRAIESDAFTREEALAAAIDRLSERVERIAGVLSGQMVVD